MLVLSLCLIHLFAVAVPGPDFLVTSRTGLVGTKKNIFQVALGITLGSTIWSLLSLFGLQILFEYYPFLNKIMLLCGSVYLMYLAYTIYKQANHPYKIQSNPCQSFFLLGFITNLSNPKAILYFASIFTVLLSHTKIWFSLILVLILTIESFAWFLLIGLGFSHSTIKQFYQGYQSHIDKVSASVFVLFAFLLIGEALIK